MWHFLSRNFIFFAMGIGVAIGMDDGFTARILILLAILAVSVVLSIIGSLKTGDFSNDTQRIFSWFRKTLGKETTNG